VPALLIGRLARDLHFRGRGLGELLLSDALRRCHRLSTELGAIGVVVEAIDETARTFSERCGFTRFPEQEFRLILPMATIPQVIAGGEPPTPTPA
jgi:GNAT superfamily N-acetyltransferase